MKKIPYVLGVLALIAIAAGMTLVFRSSTFTYDTERVGPPVRPLEVTLYPDIPRLDGNRLEIGGTAREVRVLLSQGGRSIEAPVERSGPRRHTARLDFPSEGSWTVEVRLDGSPVARYVVTVGTPGLTPVE